MKPWWWVVCGCAVPVPDPNPIDPNHDFDGDGLHERDGDCDDQDASVGAAELRYLDADGDGLFALDPALVCAPGIGQPAPGTDCDDTDAAIDDGVEAFVDQDGDGVGVTPLLSVGCVLPPTGYASIDGDCDDGDPSIPGLDRCYTDDTDESCGGERLTCALEGQVDAATGIAFDHLNTIAPGVPFGGGDLDGDGLPDVGIGGAGVASGPPESLHVLLSRYPTYQIVQVLPPDDVSSCGVDSRTDGRFLDFDGNGADDLMVLCHDADLPSAPTTAWLVYGPVPPSMVSLSVNWVAGHVPVRTTAEPGARLGIATASGDLDGDGKDDLVFTGPAGASDPSFVAVLHGRDDPGAPLALQADAVVLTEPPAAVVGLGDDAAVVLDFDGSGAPGLLLASHGDFAARTEALLFDAADLTDTSDLSSVAYGDWAAETWVGPTQRSQVEWDDLDGSGRGDLILGAPHADGAAQGSVYVVTDPSPTGSETLIGNAAHATLFFGGEPSCGAAVAAVPDLFGTDEGGLAIGCPDQDGFGRIWLIPYSEAVGSLDLGASAFARIESGTFTQLGSSLAALGDTTADGGVDFASGVADPTVAAVLFHGGAL